MHTLIHANKLMRYFFLTILSLSLACSKNPANPDFSLSGTVHLEGQEDHRGVAVALNLYSCQPGEPVYHGKIGELLISIK